MARNQEEFGKFRRRVRRCSMDKDQVLLLFSRELGLLAPPVASASLSPGRARLTPAKPWFADVFPGGHQNSNQGVLLGCEALVVRGYAGESDEASGHGGGWTV